jgi:hypothetical protein
LAEPQSPIREFERLISSETGAIGRRLVYLDTIEI